MAEAGRRVGNELLGEFLGGTTREEAGMGIDEAVHLLAHGGQHIGMIVAEAGDSGAAGGVDIGFALAIGDRYALAADGLRVGMGQRAV
jgi:hypothetical protein